MKGSHAAMVPLSPRGRGVRGEGAFTHVQRRLCTCTQAPSPPTPLPRGERGEHSMAAGEGRLRLEPPWRPVRTVEMAVGLLGAFAREALLTRVPVQGLAREEAHADRAKVADRHGAM